MLDIQCEEYLAEVRKKADELKLRESLEGKLAYLDTFAEETGRERGHTRCRLWADSAPLSFYFVMEVKDATGEYKRWFNGGCIFYGSQDSGVGAPQFSVRMQTGKSGWEINT